jgi:hypothetical protein
MAESYQILLGHLESKNKIVKLKQAAAIGAASRVLARAF